MTYTDFAEHMLLALYQETEREESDPFGITLGSLIERYGLPDNSRWTTRLADEWRQEGLADISDTLGPATELAVEITGKGMRVIERSYGSKDGVGTVLQPVDALPNVIATDSGQPLVTEGGDYIVAQTSEAGPISQISEAPKAIASETWTGIESRLARDSSAVERIRWQVVQLDQEIEKLGLSNTERAKVKAITEALVKLVESPEPEWKAIVDLLRSPTLAGIAGIAGLVLGIIQIVMSA